MHSADSASCLALSNAAALPSGNNNDCSPPPLDVVPIIKRRETDQVTLCSVAAGDTEALLLKVPPTPVPKLPLISLCLARLSDPITFTQIFPYVNEMMQELGVASSPSQVGFYSGIVESVFAVSQLITIFPMARLSDKIGRRPVVLAGVVGIALATVVFGLSRTLISILITRCLAGALAGNVATMQAMLTEMSDASNQAFMLPAYGLCWPVGSIIGPLIGGAFSRPAERFSIFKGSKFFIEFPYFLPCFISSIFALGTVVVGYFCLDETLPRKRRILNSDGSRVDLTKAYGTVNRTNPTSQEAQREADIDMPEMQATCPCDWNMPLLLKIPAVRDLAISSLALSFLSGGFDVIFVLFCYLPISTGGLGYSAMQIGYALAIAGSSAALLQLLVMPSLLRRCSPLTAYKYCMKLWPVAYIFLPFLNLLARMGLDSASENEVLTSRFSALLWVGVGVCLAMTRIANLAFSLSVILVKDTTPSPDALGATNGLAQFAMCLARSVAPASVSVLFAASIDYNLMGSYFWVCVMVAFAWVGIYVTDRINIIAHEYPLDKAVVYSH
ncbi:hypothetical protein M422DRAFT_67512 [Sphaerobolus stellatus SS14]|uniref:Major facilitator superfamily (MFS) profile domain-containing protein n=1 Tax=Sphaerobolus stellatus (strain SS14) TaxID=990650 RepID=A0A0C9VPT0_SPHS4|nr:hypothetical protein M422DRAFT_67512 [Sphaerobolus stellatus SS14]